MLPEENALQIFYKIYYSTNLILSLCANFVLLYFMKTTKSSLLKEMQYYLLNTTVFEILVCLSAYFAQCRPVANVNSLGVFCHGPCKYFGPTYCYLGFAIVQCAVVAATFSVLLAFYYRYRLLLIEVNKHSRHLKNFGIFAILPISMFVFQMCTDSDFTKVEEETRQLHPHYDYTENVLIGYSNAKGIGPIIAQATISIGVYIAPIIAFYYRHKINKILSMNSNNRLPVKYCKQLITGLMIQALLPFCVYIPPYSYFLISQYSGKSNIYLEYILNVFGSLTAIINPILTLYYVLPYRRAFKRVLFKQLSPSVTEEPTEMVSVINVTHHFQRNKMNTVAASNVQSF